MLKADFSEQQFQQLFNNEFANGLSGMGIQPIIPTPRQEYSLGWDTGYNMPSLGLPIPSQKYCNLFLQYKLAEMIDDPRGGQWHYWNRPYLRFHIPHWKSPGHPGRKYPDFHQYYALRNLVNKGYAAFYVTNHTIDLGELLEWANHKIIVDKCPALHVGYINEEHILATFIEASRHYFLQSESEEVPSTTWDMVIDIFMESPMTSLEEDLDIFPELFSKHEMFSKEYDLRKMQMIEEPIESRWILLHQTMSQVIGLNWWKLDAKIAQ